MGSRQVIEGGNSYCSAVCCTYTQKQVILTKEHDAEAQCTVFHNDIRSHGKDFERFYERAEKLPGVRFIRSYVSIAQETPETKNVIIRYATPADGVKEEEFDLVVLSVGLNPPADAQGLAVKFGVELNPHHFCWTGPFNPMETSRPGVFVSGAFQGPVDIPEAVFTASGAARSAGICSTSPAGGSPGNACTRRNGTSPRRSRGSGFGRPVTYVDVPPREAEAAMRTAGIPEWMADAMIGLYGIFAAGHASTTTRVVEDSTGTPARTYAAFAREHAETFAAA